MMTVEQMKERLAELGVEAPAKARRAELAVLLEEAEAKAAEAVQEGAEEQSAGEPEAGEEPPAEAATEADVASDVFAPVEAVALGRTNVRAEPSLEAPVVRVLEDGERVIYHVVVDGWAELEDGWAMAQYLAVPLA